MVDFVRSTRHHVITGLPLLFTRVGGVGADTVVAAAGQWYPLLPSVAPGELLAANMDALGGQLLPAPDFTFANIDLNTHLLTPNWPPGPWRMPVTMYLASNQFGSAINTDPLIDIRVALFDVQDGAPGGAGGAIGNAELLWQTLITGVNGANPAADTLTLTMTTWPRRTANLRLYLMNVTNTDNLTTDIRQLAFRVPIGA